MRGLVRHSRFGFMSLVICLLAGACKKSDEEKSTSSASTGSLRIAMVAAGNGDSTSLRLNPVSFDEFKNKTISSAAPDSMTVAITRMSLYNSKTQKVVPIFSDDNGKEITIAGSRVDLSSLFTKIDCMKSDGTILEIPEGKTCKCGVDANGELIDLVDGSDELGQAAKVCPQPAEGDIPPFGVMEVSQVGDFDTLQVTFLNKGQASGCVAGRFQADTQGPITDATYCTKSGLDLDSTESMTKGDYPSSDPTAGTIYWSKSGKDAGESIAKNFTISNNISISEDGETPQITLIIDKGRLLRFYDGSGDSGPNPNSPSDKAYFFSTVFEESIYVFVGRVGAIRGYRFAVSVNTSEDIGATVPSSGSRECSSNCTFVNGWMTIIENVDGRPFAVSLMPDDDNALVVAKGTNASSSSTGTFDSSLITVNDDSTWNVAYTLKSPGKSEGLSGTIYSLDPSLAVGLTQTLELTADQTDSAMSPFRAWGTLTLERAQ